jgi:serine protease Do
MTDQSGSVEGSRPDGPTNRYEPQPDPRPRWSAGLGGVPATPTPDSWFEPDTVATQPAGTRLAGAGLVVVLLAVSILGAVLGGGGMFLLLRQSGALDNPTASAAQTIVPVVVAPEYSAIIQAAQRVGPSVVMVETIGPLGQGIGSGVIYHTAGWILTNRHVVADASRVDVRLADGRTFTADVYGLDTLTDLAILRIKGATGLVAAQMGDSVNLQVGQLAIAIGSPMGEEFPNSVTSGIVSALGRDVTVASDTGSTGTSMHGLIQTDAAINPGNSGGPLVDSSGRVIGITTALASSAQGIGFAIPIDIAKPIMQQALAGEPLSRPFMGITYVPIDRGVAAKNNLPLDQGAWVHREDQSGRSIEAVLSGGPADLAGIETGDIITAIEGYRIDSTHLLEDILVRYAPGRVVSVEYYRSGKYATTRVTLGTRPTETS